MDQATGQMEENLLEDWDCEKVMDSGIREELDKQFGVCILMKLPQGYSSESCSVRI